MPDPLSEAEHVPGESQCHSENFARGELEKGDEMIRQADHLLAKAIRIIAGLVGSFVGGLILSLLFWRFNTLGTGIKIILLFLGTPTVFLGFWLGGLMMAFFSRMFSKTVTTLDDIGTGKIDPIEEIRHSFDEVKDSVEESLHWGDENEEQQEGTADKPETGRVSSQEEQRAKEDQEALDALRQFQKGKK